MNGFTQRVKTAWPGLGWAIKSRWLELVGHFYCYDHKGPRKQCSHLVGPPPVFKADGFLWSCLELLEQLDQLLIMSGAAIDSQMLIAVLCAFWSAKNCL